MLQRLLSQLVAPVVIVGIGAGGLMWLSTKSTPPQRVAQQPAPQLVETVALQSDVPQFQIHVNGNVVPSREVTLSAQIDGEVSFKGDSIESGRQVAAGTPLLQIDGRRFQIQVDKMGSEIARVQTDQRRLAIEEQGNKSLIELARRELKLAVAASKRLQALAQRNATSTAEAEAVERAEVQSRNKLQLLLMESELAPIRSEQVQAQLDLARFEQRLAQLNLDHTKVDAPFSGIIVSVMVEQGDYVQTGDPLLKLADMSTVDVQCSLQLDDLYWLWNSTASPRPTDIESPAPASQRQLAAGAAHSAPTQDDLSAPSLAAADTTDHVFEVPSVEATVTSEVGGQSFHWPGQLARFEGAGINRNTRTVLCRVRVAQPIRDQDDDGPPALMRGMYLTVTLNVTPRAKLLKIPARAVQPNGRVLTVDDGVLQVHSIQPAKVLADSVVVRTDGTDLKGGDHVVITQLVAPVDGSAVREIVRQAKADESSSGERNDVP